MRCTFEVDWNGIVKWRPILKVLLLWQRRFVDKLLIYSKAEYFPIYISQSSRVLFYCREFSDAPNPYTQLSFVRSVFSKQWDAIQKWIAGSVK